MKAGRCSSSGCGPQATSSKPISGLCTTLKLCRCERGLHGIYGHLDWGSGANLRACAVVRCGGHAQDIRLGFRRPNLHGIGVRCNRMGLVGLPAARRWAGEQRSRNGDAAWNFTCSATDGTYPNEILVKGPDQKTFRFVAGTEATAIRNYLKAQYGGPGTPRGDCWIKEPGPWCEHRALK